MKTTVSKLMTAAVLAAGLTGVAAAQDPGPNNPPTPGDNGCTNTGSGGCNGDPTTPTDGTPGTTIVNKPVITNTNTATGGSATATGGNATATNGDQNVTVNGAEANSYAPSVVSTNFTICGKSFGVSAGVVEFSAGMSYSKTDMECFQEYMSRTEIQKGMTANDLVIRKLTVAALLEANPYYKAGVDNMSRVEDLYVRFGEASAPTGPVPNMTVTSEGCPVNSTWDPSKQLCVLVLKPHG